MADARDSILAGIRHAQNRTALSPETQARLERGLSEPDGGPRPAFEQNRTERFTQRVEASAASLEHIAAWRELPARVVALLARYSLPPQVTVAPHADLQGLAWEGLDTAFRAAQGADRVSVSRAFAGVAETGSLALVSGAQTPTTLNFLPELHVVALAHARVLAHLEDLWTLLRRELGALPRAVNLITGPSRTADIEQTLQLGAHGPKRLHIVLIGEA